MYFCLSFVTTGFYDLPTWPKYLLLPFDELVIINTQNIWQLEKSFLVIWAISFIIPWMKVFLSWHEKVTPYSPRPDSLQDRDNERSGDNIWEISHLPCRTFMASQMQQYQHKVYSVPDIHTDQPPRSTGSSPSVSAVSTPTVSRMMRHATGINLPHSFGAFNRVLVDVLTQGRLFSYRWRTSSGTSFKTSVDSSGLQSCRNLKVLLTFQKDGLSKEAGRV